MRLNTQFSLFESEILSKLIYSQGSTTTNSVFTVLTVLQIYVIGFDSVITNASV